MKIVFNVKARKNIALGKLKPFQGDLKKLSDENHSKLRNEMIEDGFNFAPHIWEHGGSTYILDGHQRIYTLKQLAKEGYQFVRPDGSEQSGVPCNTIEAKDINSAKRKVLQAVSQYGKLDDVGFKDFTIDVDFSMDGFDFPDFEIPTVDEPATEGNTDDDSIPAVNDNPYGVKRGDVWLLGAYLHCEKCNQEFKTIEHMEGDKCPNCN